MSGVGRCGRSWISEEGNLFMSAIKKVPEDTNYGMLSLSIGCVVHKALSRYIPNNNLYLHWPNDVYYERSKIAGILITAIDGIAVISIGINVVSSPEISKTTSIKEVLGGCIISADKLLGNIISVWNDFLLIPFEGVRDYWLRNVNELNCTITIKNGVDSLSGIFRGINDDGKLILERDGRDLLISSGDMFLSTERIVVNYG
jgi:BirA family biotin operon repressor/biotin-[acetyl-CoA-carboxylase] ligase